MQQFQVYILKSESTGRYYTGISSDPDNRLEMHNKGLNTSTKNKGPWVRIWLSESMSKAEALILERKIKSRGAGRFLAEKES